MPTMDFHAFASDEGWSERTQIGILLDYIENQASPEAFRDFLDARRGHREPMAEPDVYLWNVAERLQNPGLTRDAAFQEFCGNIFEVLTVEEAATEWLLREAPAER